MINKRFLSVVSGFVACVLAFSSAGRVLYAQMAPTSKQSVQQDQSSQQTQTSTENADLTSAQGAKRVEFLNRIKNELSMAQQDYSSIRKNVRDTEEKMTGVHTQVLTLRSQINNLDQQIDDTTALINNVLTQIAEKENEQKRLAEDIEIKKIEIENQKKVLLEYLKVIYEQDSGVYDTTSKDTDLNITKLLLSDKPLAETLQEMRYFSIFEETGRQIFDRLDVLVKEQEQSQIDLENAGNKLTMLKRELDEDQQNLEIQREAKAKVLEETQGQEKIYVQLLDESKKEQAQTLQDISSLRDNLSFIQQKISELGDKFNPNDYKNVIGEQANSVYNYIASTKDDQTFSPRWPVSPSRGISAYFHDSAYLHAMGVPHEAIDIKAMQGTPIHAPADGIVYKTRDNGYGYSYIILAHNAGFMTLYGHVSEIRVKEGDKITVGQVIGLSGATPGTKGAGLMTTGAHLHFEMFKAGKHVDPLDYLPLSYLPLDSLPAKYLSRITGEQHKVSRQAPTDPDQPTNDDLIQRSVQNGQMESENL